MGCVKRALLSALIFANLRPVAPRFNLDLVDVIFIFLLQQVPDVSIINLKKEKQINEYRMYTIGKPFPC